MFRGTKLPRHATAQRLGDEGPRGRFLGGTLTFRGRALASPEVDTMPGPDHNSRAQIACLSAAVRTARVVRCQGVTVFALENYVAACRYTVTFRVQRPWTRIILIRSVLVVRLVLSPGNDAATAETRLAALVEANEHGLAYAPGAGRGDRPHAIAPSGAIVVHVEVPEEIAGPVTADRPMLDESASTSCCRGWGRCHGKQRQKRGQDNCKGQEDISRVFRGVRCSLLVFDSGF